MATISQVDVRVSDIGQGLNVEVRVSVKVKGQIALTILTLPDLNLTSAQEAQLSTSMELLRASAIVAVRTEFAVP
jgi:hypothetical protein